MALKVLADENIPFLKGRLEGIGADVTYLDQHAFTADLARDADILLIRTRTRINRELLEGSRVKLVATATIGTDQIDTDYCRKAGVEVRNSPGCNAPGVAQYVWSSLLRMGFDPTKHKLGVVGKGNVGKIVVDWGRRLGSEVLVCDPPRQKHGETDEQYLTLEELASKVDAITFHTPLTHQGPDATFHLGDSHILSLLRPGALLVNAARGPVVSKEALVKELKTGRIKAAIDTWEGEPEVDREILRLADFATFHIAGYSRQGKERATRMILEAVEDNFGVEIDKSGLEGEYKEPSDLSVSKILDSYDPATDTAPLRQHPDRFETLRHDYHYREEV